MYIDYLTINWDRIEDCSYLRTIPSLQGLDRLEFRSPVTIFVGENGSGKSTLLEAIAIAYGFNPEGGSYNYRFSTYDDYSDLAGAMTLGRGIVGRSYGYFLRAESFYNASTKLIEYERELGRPMYGDKTLHDQSHGESFLSFILAYKRRGLFIMDEPEAALSPNRQLTLFSHMAQMVEKGSQFIVVSHSPILLGFPGADILCFDGETLHPQEYRDTESYRITELFINHGEQIIKELMNP